MHLPSVKKPTVSVVLLQMAKILDDIFVFWSIARFYFVLKGKSKICSCIIISYPISPETSWISSTNSKHPSYHLMLSCYENHNILLWKAENILKGKKKKIVLPTYIEWYAFNVKHWIVNKEKKHKKANKPPPELGKRK